MEPKSAVGIYWSLSVLVPIKPKHLGNNYVYCIFWFILCLVSAFQTLPSLIQCYQFPKCHSSQTVVYSSKNCLTVNSPYLELGIVFLSHHWEYGTLMCSKTVVLIVPNWFPLSIGIQVNFDTKFYWALFCSLISIFSLHL